MQSYEDATLTELQNGYIRGTDGALICLSCGQRFETGEVYPFGEHFYTAERALQQHLQEQHADRLEELLRGSSEILSLTDKQKELLTLFYKGLSDKETAAQLSISPSTVRHQRFMFRERAKAAKLYLAVWSLVEERKNKQQAQILPVHKGAIMVDDRYNITETEYEKILGNVFESLKPLKLKIFSAKEKKKIVILRKLAEQFEAGRNYTEKEVNDILGNIYADYAMLRRYLIEYGYLERTRDCSRYWRK